MGAAALALLAVGLGVACREEDDTAPPRLAATVPNAPLTAPTGTADGSDTPPAPTILTVAIDIDPSVAFEQWHVTITRDDGTDLGEHNFQEHQHQWTLRAPAGAEPSGVTIRVQGESTLSDGTLLRTSERVAHARFQPTRNVMAYLYIDASCAYRSAQDPCPPEESCAESFCRPVELGDLPDFTSNWRTSPPNPCATTDGSVVLEIGEGASAFALRNDGDTITIECGPQGGHHLWIGLRMRGFTQRTSSITLSAPLADGGTDLLAATPIPRFLPTLDPTAPPHTCDYSAVLFRLDPDGRPVTPYLGQELVLQARLWDPAFHLTTITRRLRIADKLGVSCGGP